MKKILLLLFALPHILLSQSDRYTATAVHKKLDEARSSALNALIQQIQVVVTSNSERRQSEINDLYSDDMLLSTAARSTMSLTDVLETVETLPDKSFRVTKTVPKTSVLKMFNDRRKKIIDHLQEAQSIAFPISLSASVPLHSSLINYFQAYLLTILYPDTLSFGLGKTSGMTSVMVGIPNTIDQIASAIKFIPVKMIDDEFIVWKYRVEYNGRPVQSLRYSYYDGMGQGEGDVQDGETMITLFYPKKELKERTLSVNLEYLNESEMDDVLRMGYASKAVSRLLKMIPVKVPGSAVLPPEPVKPPEQLSMFASKSTRADHIKTELERLSRKGFIVTGKASDFETLHGLYCLVIDRSGVQAFMKNDHNKYYDYISGASKELKEYSGMRIIWIELLK